ncbi:hypothetical protein IFM89_001700 [Coptis chinensis]|uniref:DNA-directed RNA polymerase subunit beta n=1 Tax=Coptis chinensis TaxID=261450 RepID=A0A835LQE3_9MAGN|nr:hypothetical protein IFM89_001700 [Coptis chinensis]
MEVVEDVEKAETSSKNKSKASTSMQEQEHQKFPSEEKLFYGREVDVEPGYDPSENGGRGSAWRRATVKFGKVKLEKPVFWSNESSKPLKMLPRHARLQRMTYSSRIKVEVDFQVYVLGKRGGKVKTGEEYIKKVESEEKREVVIGKIPVMVGSIPCWMNGREKGECEFDHGGYFVKEQRRSDSRLFFIMMLHLVFAFLIFVAQEQKCYKRLWVYEKPSCFLLWVFLFALGMPSDKEIVEIIDINLDDATSVNLLQSTISYADNKFEGFHKAGNALEIVKKSILNDGISSTKFPPKESGFPLESARDCLDKHTERWKVKTIQRDLYGERTVRQIECYIDASIITNGLSRAFSTGIWPHHVSSRQKISGVAVTLQRTNPLQMMSEMRNVRQYVKYTGIVGDARFPCYYTLLTGGSCVFSISTQDGENCGLVKNLAVTGLVSTNLREPLLDKLLECGMEKLTDGLTTMSLKGKDKIFLNGDWVGVCKDSPAFVQVLKSKHRSKEVPRQVEIKRDQQQGEVRIFSDAGRILRPHLVVENLKKLNFIKGGYSMHSLLNEGILELVGIEEEEDCQTAWAIKCLLSEDRGYTHCELDPSFLLGLSCGIIPFTNHDQAKRSILQSWKHSKQAIGFFTTNPSVRVDTGSHQMYYPQRPLFRTMVSDCLGKPSYRLGQNVHAAKPEIYDGQNAIVAVSVHQGYNQEDELVMNQASLERDSLDDDGFPFIGANLRSGDIVIDKSAESGVDHSIKLKHTEGGKMQRVILSANDEGTNFASVSLRQVRSPSVGDKFSSMHGQKGVIGLLESQENFPFTHQGIVPDIVINPHAFLTRKTPGQLLEAALGKGIASGGLIRYATPFVTPSVDDIIEQLHRAGYSRWGHERVCSGCYGEMMRSLIFKGPTCYQRLTHMAVHKVKFRNTGPVHPLTRQPVIDRKRFGGVKFGEMERDCLLAHGAAANLHKRLFTLSDFSHMHICEKCSNISNVIERPVAGGGAVQYGNIHKDWNGALLNRGLFFFSRCLGSYRLDGQDSEEA